MRLWLNVRRYLDVSRPSMFLLVEESGGVLRVAVLSRYSLGNGAAVFSPVKLLFFVGLTRRRPKESKVY